MQNKTTTTKTMAIIVLHGRVLKSLPLMLEIRYISAALISTQNFTGGQVLLI
jgi:hypothetical protein